MKKIGIIILVLSSLIFLSSCGQKTSSDAVKFKKEYEKYNGQKDSKGNHYPKLEISKNNIVEYIDAKEALNILNSKTGIIYMGFPTCPWCRNALPVLLDAAKESNLAKIYYLDVENIRDEKKLEKDGKIKTIKEGTKEYQDLLVRMYDFLNPYEDLQDISIKRIYVPLIVSVKDGKILKTHMSTVDSQSNPYEKMTEEQKKELKKIYVDMMKDVKDGICDEAC